MVGDWGSVDCLFATEDGAIVAVERGATGIDVAHDARVLGARVRGGVVVLFRVRAVGLEGWCGG